MQKEIPTEDDIAKELGVTVERLRTALQATKGLLSIDSPLNAYGSRKGSGAGGDAMGNGEMLMSDTLQW